MLFLHLSSLSQPLGLQLLGGAPVNCCVSLSSSNSVFLISACSAQACNGRSEVVKLCYMLAEKILLFLEENQVFLPVLSQLFLN